MRDQSQVDVLNRILNFTIILFLGPLKVTLVRVDHFRFGSVWFLSKKVIKSKSFFKKTETGSNRPVSVQFGFLGQKPVQTGLARFFRFGSVSRFWLGFFWSGSVFSGFFGFGSVRFGFLLIKPKPNRTGQFFQNFNRFFFCLFFSVIFFPVFSV